MQTQITCPRCQTPFITDVHQLIDVGQQPEMKQLLLSGQLNVAICPRCGAGGQLSTPMVYHDPAHELFMIYMPMEVNLGQMERERLIGELTRRAMNNIPTEQRRAYLLQPQTIINMETFMEKVLETEGITPEMIARQRKQAELLQTLARATDPDVVNTLLQDRASEIDETFMAMLRQSVEIANQSGSEAEALRLINLQAKLYRETEVGQRLEQRQRAVHAFSREAKKQGLTPELLARHVIANEADIGVVQNLVSAGQAAMTYEFFEALTEEVERRQAAGEAETAARLASLRDELLEVQQEIQAQSEAVFRAADTTLQTLIDAEDRETAVLEAIQANEIDDTFMYLLEARIARAEQRRQRDEMHLLEDLRELIHDTLEQQMPPELQLLNQLIRAENEAELRQLLDSNPQSVTPQMLQLLQAVGDQVKDSGQAELNGRIKQLQAMVAERL